MPLTLSEISTAIRNPNACVTVSDIHGGNVCMQNSVTPTLGSGKFAAVYKYVLKDGTIKAIRIWTNAQRDKQIIESASEISNELRKLNCNYFFNFQFYPHAILVSGKYYPILIMDWCDGLSLKSYLKQCLTDEKALSELAENFMTMFEYLHNHKISHGDLQHENIMVEKNGQIRLLDYDSLYFPSPYFKNKKEVLYGFDSYQHPSRGKNTYMGDKTDYFSELIIYISIIAFKYDPKLWNDYLVEDSDDRMLFNASDYKDIKSSALFQRLKQMSEPLPSLCDILELYLGKDDIQQLEPFYTYHTHQYAKIGKRFCVHCGKQLDCDEQFCTKCGTKRVD